MRNVGIAALIAFVSFYPLFHLTSYVYWSFTRDTEATVSSVGRLYAVGIEGGLVGAVVVFVVSLVWLSRRRK
jgi:uncharacterized protein (TIGR03382 family)